jgi:hypothetical protein
MANDIEAAVQRIMVPVEKFGQNQYQRGIDYTTPGDYGISARLRKEIEEAIRAELSQVSAKCPRHGVYMCLACRQSAEPETFAVLERHERFHQDGDFKLVRVPPGQSLEMDEGSATRRWLHGDLGSKFHLVEFVRVPAPAEPAQKCGQCEYVRKFSNNPDSFCSSRCAAKGNGNE